jgi:hypothetical protein
MRDAANLWAAVRDARGADGRDAVWSHPDLLPTSADLDDPLGFVAREGTATADDDDFDAALAALLDSAGSEPTDEPESDTDPDDTDPDAGGEGTGGGGTGGGGTGGERDR